MTYQILCVCTANVCRSPLATAMLAQRLGPGRFDVVGAGVRAPVGRPMDPAAATELTRRGIAVPSATARQLLPDLITASDLVLTATRAHRADVLELSPRALSKTFTLLEFAALTSMIADVTDVGSLIATAATRRSHGPGDVDLLDPIGRSAQVHHDVAGAIDTAVTVIAGRLRAASDPPE